jgi:FO synthase subunit 2
MSPDVILRSALDRGEISAIEALILMQENGSTIDEVFTVADELNKRINRGVVSYAHSASITYTNICKSNCRFCVFRKKKGEKTGVTMTSDQIVAKIKELGDVTEVNLQGGLNPDLDMNYFKGVLSAIAANFPKIHICAFSPSEVAFMAKKNKMSPREVLTQLKDSGLHTMMGTSAEILNDKVRKKICPDKIKTGDWVEIIKTAHNLGVHTTATLMFGHVENEIHICEHLEILRNIQKETGGFTHFVPQVFIPQNSDLMRRSGKIRLVEQDEILRLIAVSRLFFGPFIKNIQAGWVNLGLENAIRSLSVGANDLGGTFYDGCAIRNGKTATSSVKPDDLKRAILRAGKTPQRLTAADRQVTPPPAPAHGISAFMQGRMPLGT